MKSKAVMHKLLALLLTLMWQLAAASCPESYASDYHQQEQSQKSELAKQHRATLVCLSSAYLTVAQGKPSESTSTGGSSRLIRPESATFALTSGKMEEPARTESSQSSKNSNKLWLLRRRLLI